MIDNWPELWPGLDIYWHAYNELSTDRPPSMGGIPQIPFSAIRAYAEFYGFRGEQFEDLLMFVRALDKTYREFHDEKKENKPPKSKDGMVNF